MRPSSLAAGNRGHAVLHRNSVFGSAECNTLFSGVSVSERKLVVDSGSMGGTDMGCGDRQFHDSWLVDLLTSRPTFMLDGDRLTLTSGGTVVELQDQQSAEPDRSLVGPRWKLETIEDGAGPDSTASSVPADVMSTLRFRDDGVLVAAPGCNQGSAGHQLSGADIALKPMVLTEMACDGPAMEVESAVVQVLDGSVTLTIDGPVLRLTGGDRTLVYRAG